MNVIAKDVLISGFLILFLMLVRGANQLHGTGDLKMLEIKNLPPKICLNCKGVIFKEGNKRFCCRKCSSYYYYHTNKEKINFKKRKRYREDLEYYNKSKKQRAETYIRTKQQHLLNQNRWVKNNPEKVKEIKRRYRESHREELREKGREYTRRQEIRDREKEKRLKNEELLKKQKKRYYKNNKELFSEKNKKYRIEHKDKIKLIQKEYRIKNKEKMNLYTKLRRKNDSHFRIRHYIRTRINKMFSFYTLTGKIMSSKKYGIDYKAIIEHLKPFPEDLSKYHIDHIRPLCSFDFINSDGSTNLEEVKKAFAPENHQWLLAEENLSKSSLYNGRIIRKNAIAF